jgi:phosphoadenosine phosphosulfate reductase
MTPEAVLERAVERHGSQLVLLCSFQKTSSVLVDMLTRLTDTPRVATLDTGVLFPETLDTWRRFEEHFGIEIEVYDASGPWDGGDLCCGDAKVWTDRDVWRRITERSLPYNPLHDRGYDSIGCMPCTVPGRGRDGRWADSEQQECGIHVV